MQPMLSHFMNMNSDHRDISLEWIHEFSTAGRSQTLLLWYFRNRESPLNTAKSLQYHLYGIFSKASVVQPNVCPLIRPYRIISMKCAESATEKLRQTISWRNISRNWWRRVETGASVETSLATCLVPECRSRRAPAHSATARPPC